MKSITVRPLLFGDIAATAKWIMTLAFFERYGYEEKKLVRDLERALKRSDLVLVAEAKQAKGVCGLAWCQAGAAFGRSGYLRLLAVSVEQQGQGIGNLLLKEVEVFVQEVSYDLFFLLPDFAEDLQGLAEAKGYQQVGSVPGYTLPNAADLIYRKRLD